MTNPHVKAAAPYVLGQAMLSVGEANRGAVIRGVDPVREAAVADIGAHMRAGALTDLKPGEFGIVLGVELARALGVRMGDPVVVITPQGTMTPAGTLPRLKTFRVVGVFEVGMYEFDSGLALIDLDDAKKLYRLDGVSGVRLKLDDLFLAPAVARELAGTLRINGEVRDWTRSHANFFRAVQIEKRVMFIILTLIIAVSAFNIVSAQVMTVTDKLADIAILRTLGAAPSSITAIFMIQGALIGLIGTLIGVVGGVAARAQRRHRAAGDRAAAQRAVPRQDDLLHQRAAVRSAARRRRHDCRDRAGAGARRHDLSGMARRKSQSGGSVAL